MQASTTTENSVTVLEHGSFNYFSLFIPWDQINHILEMPVSSH